MAKHRQISDTITQAIRDGEYEPGQKLPTEREFAEKFGVHRMTVRQATATLAANGLIIKRLPAGIFVRSDVSAVTSQRINIICPGGALAQANAFIKEGIRQAKLRNLKPRVLRIYPGDEHLAVEAIASSDPTLLIGIHMDRRGSMLREARRASERVVVIGSRMDHAGLASVVGDDELGLRLAVEYLHKLGHQRIGLVCSLPGDTNALMEVQVQQFRYAVELLGSGHVRPQEVLRLDKAIFEQSTVAAACAAVEDYFKHRREPATAFIGLSEESTHGAAAALHRLGKKVPEDVSLLGYALTPLSAFAIPPHTGIDIGIEGHINAALAWIDAAGKDETSKPPLRQRITPLLVERESVAAPTDAGAEHSAKGRTKLRKP